MGICASCLRGRGDRRRRDSRARDETQPLLDDSVAGGEDAGAESSEQGAARQQELAQIVQKTHDYFIDVSAISSAEPTDPPADLSDIERRIDAWTQLMPRSTRGSANGHT